MLTRVYASTAQLINAQNALISSVLRRNTPCPALAVLTRAYATVNGSMAQLINTLNALSGNASLPTTTPGAYALGQQVAVQCVLNSNTAQVRCP